MKIRILGGGFYGSHLALALLADGHEVELHEIAERLFSGASGNIPARLHSGTHYPRSKLTRDACLEHRARFMTRYGAFTRGVRCNVYAVAQDDSLLDFGTYLQIVQAGLHVIPVSHPAELGLESIEGAILTGERHVRVDMMRDFFTAQLEGHLRFGVVAGLVDDPAFDLTVDATFCAHENAGVDRYEVCLTMLLEGPTDFAITVMDGPFPSLYPWDEEAGLCSLTSAKFTPLFRRYDWNSAKAVMDELGVRKAQQQGRDMIQQMARFYPAVADYRIADHRLAIRAMPRSAADARLIDVLPIGEKALRIRAGKIDAIFKAEDAVKSWIERRL